MKKKVTRKQVERFIAHALLHLKANKIADPNSKTGWYCGDKATFAATHQKAIEYFEAVYAAEER